MRTETDFWIRAMEIEAIPMSAMPQANPTARTGAYSRHSFLPYLPQN